MKPIKVMTVFGTRPEAIKMAPIILAMQQRPNEFTPITVVTAQHREMLDQVLNIFHIQPDYDLNIMRPKQTLSGITTRISYSFMVIRLQPLQPVSAPFITNQSWDTLKLDCVRGISTRLTRRK